MLQISMPGNNLEKNRNFGVVLRKNNLNRKNKVSTKVIFLFHEAPNINFAENEYFDRSTTKQSSKNQNCINELKKDC